MHISSKLIILTIATVLTAGPVRADWHSKYFEGKNQSADAINSEITSWINEQKPKDINSIKGFISQSLTGGPGGDYNVHVYVDSTEGTQVPIKIKVRQYNWFKPTKNGPGSKTEDFISTLQDTHGNIVILGFYGGHQGHSIFYVVPE